MQQGFGQFCPVALASEVLTQRWSLLKTRLEALERAEIIERRRVHDRDVDEYFLTRAGRDLRPVLRQIGEWGQRWARDIRPEDLDPGWLVWNIHRRLDTNEMPAGRTVIQIEFTDAPRNHKYFWLVHENGRVEVCLKSPGFEVSLVVKTTVRVMAEAWRGIRNLRTEIRAGRMVLEGPAPLRRAFPRWLLLSTFAPVKRKRHASRSAAIS